MPEFTVASYRCSHDLLCVFLVFFQHLTLTHFQGSSRLYVSKNFWVSNSKCFGTQLCLCSFRSASRRRGLNGFLGHLLFRPSSFSRNVKDETDVESYLSSPRQFGATELAQISETIEFPKTFTILGNIALAVWISPRRPRHTANQHRLGSRVPHHPALRRLRHPQIPRLPPTLLQLQKMHLRHGQTSPHSTSATAA